MRYVCKNPPWGGGTKPLSAHRLHSLISRLTGSEDLKAMLQKVEITKLSAVYEA